MFYSVRTFNTSSLRDSILSDPVRPALRRQGEEGSAPHLGWALPVLQEHVKISLHPAPRWG